MTGNATPYVDPDLTAAGAALKERGLVAPDPVTAPMDEVRAAQERIGAFLGAETAPVDSESSLFLAGPGGSIEARLYVADGEAEKPPLLVYFHGGGFAYGSARAWDGLMRDLARRSGVAILNVDYRLAPEHRFPAGVADAVAVLERVQVEGDSWGIDRSRVAVGGDSAGANLALVAALSAPPAARRALRLLLLFYGVYSRDAETESWRRLGTGTYGLSQTQMRWIWQNYLGDEASDDWRIAPLHGDFTGLPPVLQVVGSLDPLFDDAVALQARLDAAGVANRLSIYDGVNHGFIRFSQLIGRSRSAVDEAARTLRAVLVEDRPVESGIATT